MWTKSKHLIQESADRELIEKANPQFEKQKEDEKDSVRERKVVKRMDELNKVLNERPDPSKDTDPDLRISRANLFEKRRQGMSAEDGNYYFDE